jgi:hypothetical protein
MNEVLLRDPSSTDKLQKKDLDAIDLEARQLNVVGKAVGLSNKTVLGITCALFALFVVAEIIGALVSEATLFCRLERLHLGDPRRL